MLDKKNNTIGENSISGKGIHVKCFHMLKLYSFYPIKNCCPQCIYKNKFQCCYFGIVSSVSILLWHIILNIVE